MQLYSVSKTPAGLVPELPEFVVVVLKRGPGGTRTENGSIVRQTGFESGFPCSNNLLFFENLWVRGGGI